jgi:sterol desaturase/sphingolipid hydroxylase (fatty acid hydroxylase superfamily)
MANNSEEGQGSQRAVVPVMMMMMMMMMMIMMNNELPMPLLRVQPQSLGSPAHKHSDDLSQLPGYHNQFSNNILLLLLLIIIIIIMSCVICTIRQV